MLICKVARINHVDESDFESEEEYEKLVNAERIKADVAVISIELDGGTGNAADNYYNVVLTDGTIVEAMSGYHLVGIENWK